MIGRRILRMLAPVIMLMGGCQREESAPAARVDESASQPRASVTLRVLVVNEPELAEAITRLRGEWTERSGGELTATGIAWADLTAAKAVDADLIVFPSRYLGELCIRDWLRPVRPNVLASRNFDAADVFPLVRRELINWGGQTMALPLGLRLPRTSNEVSRHPGMSLLAHAAPFAVSDDRMGVLFDPETMKPRITAAPFVESLIRLTGPIDESRSSAMDDVTSVPVLGYDDRLAAVTKTSRNAASAFNLLAWLAQPDTSSQLARAGERTMPVRRSLAASQEWYDPNVSATERAALGKTLEAMLSGERCPMIPRIPGIDDYLAALDQAVNDAVDQGIAPQAALEKAAQRWEAITDAHGRDAQREAYLKHLGINE
jgi:hypothetical protein